MTPAEVKAIVGDTPYMSLEQADRATRFIADHGVRDILELGFAHGVSSCYFAAALQAAGGGSVTSIDLISAQKRQPNITELLEACGLSDFVTTWFEPRSLTWRLMRMLEDGEGERFDLVYLDAGHNWDVTGFAFFLVNRLLRPNGWLIFDDIDWTHSGSPTLKDSATVKKMPKDYRDTPQVRKVFELLVETHPGYSEHRIDNRWGYARKRPTAA